MPVDYQLRRDQLQQMAHQIQYIEELVKLQHGQEDRHVMAHYFEQRTGKSIKNFLLDLDHVLIPNMADYPEWAVLIPEVLDTVAPLRDFDTTPRYGCPHCRW
jgi:hypothetical protein